jgi:SAM-dependent methyltransferase
MPPVTRYHWDSPEYADAFAALLRCSGEREHVRRILGELIGRYPRESRAIDWGAGGGDLTALLLGRFKHVYAVEPNPSLRAALAARCPAAEVVDGTLASAVLPAAVQVGLISHVFYHVPDHKWGAYTIRAANHLAPDGVLAVLLIDPDAGSNVMMEHFGAPRLDLYAGLSGVLRRHREFQFTFSRCPGNVRTTSFEETLQIARFVLCDRDADAYSRPPTEDEFRQYVRAHFWDERAGAGGYDYDVVFCCVRRSPGEPGGVRGGVAPAAPAAVEP